MSDKAVSFYHEDGLIPAWNLASMYAGEDGHLATLPEIIDARLRSDQTNKAWRTWFTTASFEMIGRSRTGNLILIVVHKNFLPNMCVGISSRGSLAATVSRQRVSKEWVAERYSFEFKDKKRDNRGGRISKEDFYKFESGAQGDVSIIDLGKYIRDNTNPEFSQYVFLSPIQSDVAMYEDPLVKARLGPHYLEYIERHRQLAIEFEEKENRKRIKYPYILQMHDASNCSYRYFDAISPDGTPFFHLLSISGLTHTNFCEYRGAKLISEVSAHEWSNGTKFVGVPKNCELRGIYESPNSRDILREHWGDLWEATKSRKEGGFFTLMMMGDYWFTMYDKQGDSMDSHEPEYLVRSYEKVGEPVAFVTPITRYYGFFTYDQRDLRQLAPVGANSYHLVGNPDFAGEDHHMVMVQFCRCDIDTTQRLPRAGTIGQQPALILQYARSV